MSQPFKKIFDFFPRKNILHGEHVTPYPKCGSNSFCGRIQHVYVPECYSAIFLNIHECVILRMNTMDNTKNKTQNEYKIGPMLVTYVGDEIGL